MQQEGQTKLYPEFKSANFPEFEQEVAKFWKEKNIFQKTISNRKGANNFVFYEGPPSANGMPGIHHVMSRTIKDIFCRYKTLQGFKVDRKAGWDTHGLPIELQVEKKLGITKDDIGKKISVEDYNAACRQDVMKFKSVWDNLTERIGYWVNLDNPYITYENEYIETVWYLLKEIYKKGYLYKGYTVQPYSPAAGTGLSSHELNQPGTYREVKDTTVVAQFKLIGDLQGFENLGGLNDEIYFLAWTTTPWTLPSNTALAVGPKIKYALVKTYNQYTFKSIQVILAKDLVKKYFADEDSALNFEDYKPGDKKIPFQILNELKGSDLIGLSYEQLLPYTLPAENPEKAFKVIAGDFVSTAEGTGIVHIAPTFGADDARVAKQAGVPAMLVMNEEGKLVPLVNLQGKFVKEMGEFADKYVKNEYYSTAPEKSVDVEIAIKLKEENKAFKVEKYEHSYPHCWRTDKPILYYPMESWFIKTTAVKDRLIELNKTINWKPEHTGEGRFGNWLENLVDWNLSRSRYWGTPLPIWKTEDGSEEICIGSIAELKTEAAKSVKAGFMTESAFESGHGLDLHRPYVDNIILVSPSGKPMNRETDLIDVWFDSGAMPYAQWGLKPTSTLPEGKDFGLGKGKNFGYETANPANYKFLKEFAEKNRDNLTQAESALWTLLKGDKLSHFHFRRQHIIYDYIVDFICLAKKVVIEIDGKIHNLPDNIISDQQRTDNLKKMGFEVIRFTNEEVLGDTDNVLKIIVKKLSHTPSGPHPLPFGEGRGEAWAFPADFIAEGVDQTRGWFFTLHAISTMLFDSVAYKNVVANGLVLDKNGNKMSKRLGNTVDPFATIDTYGADATRWYLIGNAAPWENLKFDIEGLAETQRKFFGTLYNTYSFFALYANLDKFTDYETNRIERKNLSELDKWILSALHKLIVEVRESLDNFEPHIATRAIQDFVNDHLSNWYVRLSRRRFWKSESSTDKQAAFETLQECLVVVSQLMSPIAPFFADWLYGNMTQNVREKAIINQSPLKHESVHLTDLVMPTEANIDFGLLERMELAQQICSMVLAIRKKEKIKVRQPLQSILMPVLDSHFAQQVSLVKDLILTEVNVKELNFLYEGEQSIFVKSAKPDFKKLGPRAGSSMKEISVAVIGFTDKDLKILEQNGSIDLQLSMGVFTLNQDEIEVITKDVEGWQVAVNGKITLALDLTISAILKQEGLAREIVNKIQNMRKDNEYEVNDRIIVKITPHVDVNSSIIQFKNYICNEILADDLITEDIIDGELTDINGTEVTIKINKVYGNRK